MPPGDGAVDDVDGEAAAVELLTWCGWAATGIGEERAPNAGEAVSIPYGERPRLVVLRSNAGLM